MSRCVVVKGQKLSSEGTHRPAWGIRAVLLAAAFALALGATGFFAIRFVVHAIYWSQHREEPIVSWMTVGYVARSYEVPPELLQEALGITPGERDRRTLAEIAAEQGRDFEALRTALLEAIAAARAPASISSRSDPSPGS